MGYFTAIGIMNAVRDVILIIAAALAFAALRHLHFGRHKLTIMQVKRNMFCFLAPAMVALSVAHITADVSAAIGGRAYASDILFAIGYTLFAAGFAYLWMRSTELHKLHIKEPVFISGVLCGVFIWLYYLFVLSIIPSVAAQPFLTKLAAYFFPIIVALIFVMTLIVHPLMKAKLIRTPLWYVSSGVFAYFIGFMMYSYHLWNVNEFLPLFSSALFLLSSLYFLLGFYAANRKYMLK
jgi:uncharacterized membrane protein